MQFSTASCNSQPVSLLSFPNLYMQGELRETGMSSALAISCIARIAGIYSLAINILEIIFAFIPIGSSCDDSWSMSNHGLIYETRIVNACTFQPDSMPRNKAFTQEYEIVHLIDIY